jgi:hypothetical protein
MNSDDELRQAIDDYRSAKIDDDLLKLGCALRYLR